MSIEFYAKCNKCGTEEELLYIGSKDSEFEIGCLKCGEKLKNEKLIKNTFIEKH